MKYLLQAFRHVIGSVPSLRDKWFTAEDWCKILPRYWGPLKDNVDQITTRKFTRAMNVDTAFGGPSVLRDYTVGNIHGVFYNPYNFGTFRTFCYLFTDRNKPCPNPPMQCGFCPYNIDDIRSTPRLTAAVTTPCCWRHTGASILH